MATPRHSTRSASARRCGGGWPATRWLSILLFCLFLQGSLASVLSADSLLASLSTIDTSALPSMDASLFASHHLGRIVDLICNTPPHMAPLNILDSATVLPVTDGILGLLPQRAALMLVAQIMADQVTPRLCEVVNATLEKLDASLGGGTRFSAHAKSAAALLNIVGAILRLRSLFTGSRR